MFRSPRAKLLTLLAATALLVVFAIVTWQYRREIRAWYAKVFGATPGMRGRFQAADVPGVNLTFSEADGPTVTTKGRVLDHIGFDVRNLEAFCEKLEAAGIELVRPYTRNPETGSALAFISDPWGTNIELNERRNPVYVTQ